MTEEYPKFIQKVKKYYDSIGNVSCPAFSGQVINFNHYGWSHLIKKGSQRRTPKDIVRRLRLVVHARSILLEKSDYQEHRIIYNSQFWSFHFVIKKKLIIVVIRKVNNGPLHFFSIMNKNVSSKNTKDLS